MTYQQVLENARTCIGPYCKACNDCNGKVCRNTMPGPGAKGEGTGFIRNAEKWREICVNMDTICPNEPVDTAVELFGTMYRYPFFAAPLGAMKMHYGDKYNDREYNSILVNACADSGIAAFTGDGINPAVMEGASGTKVLVGPENVADELKDTSVVMTKFDIGDGMQGMIGVVGPTRMDYAKVTARLSYFAESLSKMFGKPEQPQQPKLPEPPKE